MKTILLRVFVIVAIFLPLSQVQSVYGAEGIVTGGKIYHLPNWFKDSFLDFEEEAEEARSVGKHIMAFMHLDECPYCDRMLEENFREGDSTAFMKSHFEVIGINFQGDLEVAWIDGNTYTEKELIRHLGAIATPTLVFLDLDGNKVLQLNGYRDPRSFRYALDYVQAKRYQSESFADYLAQLEKPRVYAMRSHPLLDQATFFKAYSQPLMVLFEDEQCAECDRFHSNTLNHPAVLKAMDGFLFARFNTDDTRKIIDLQGKSITADEWARALNLTFRPALVLFNAGQEMFRADGILYHQHLTEGLLYTKTGYLDYKSLRDFKDAYRDSLIKSGRNVDFGE